MYNHFQSPEALAEILFGDLSFVNVAKDAAKVGTLHKQVLGHV